ncbi:MAG: DUF3810 domain-containing protein [Gemmatimonadota bacterium]|nr:DUF3810 domain-containing protein [Gemmatimonadota bacterium]
MTGSQAGAGAWRPALVWAALGGLSYAASLGLARWPGFTEAVYANGLGPLLTRPLSRLTGVLPFAVGELLASIYLVGLVTLLVHASLQVLRRRRSFRAALGAGVRRVLLHAGVLATLFYVLWGFNYARAPFLERSGWPEWSGVEAEELARLAAAAVAASDSAYLRLHGTEDAGRPTAMPARPDALEEALTAGWAEAAGRLALDAHVADVYGRAKRPWSSGVLARLGIAGIYFPFTAEANVIRDLPAVSAAHSIAHEKAHQRGVANEAEASFLGFVAAALAPDPLARYSAAVFASRQLTAALARSDREAARALEAGRLPGVRRDLADLGAFWDRFRGVGTRVGTAVNDRYLRAHGVPGGVASYALSVRLLIELARRSGEAVPSPAGPAEAASTDLLDSTSGSPGPGTRGGSA